MKTINYRISTAITAGKWAIIGAMILAAIIAASIDVNAQLPTKPVAAVLGIDTKGIPHDKETISYILRLELEKANVYSIMDKYDVAEIAARNKLDITKCFGKSCVLAAGKLLQADKMLTGNIERFEEKIVISLKVIDVKSENVERQDATEYLNVEGELQRMIGISVQKVLGLTPDPRIVDQLIDYDTPVESPRTQLSLNGPRMGFSMATGDAAEVLRSPESQGGYNMYPTTFQFGWQKEWQYLSAGDFQALVELIPMIGGLESGKFIPSLTFLNGFRMGKGGWEFAFGPSFRIVRKAEGFVGDGNYGTTEGQWYLASDYYRLADNNQSMPQPNPYPLTRRLDSRGDISLSTSLFIGVGKTFKSGYLNIPVNAYVLPKKEGTTVGVSFGFNIYKGR